MAIYLQSLVDQTKSTEIREPEENLKEECSPRVQLNKPAWSIVPITFDENDFQVQDFPHIDAFVATANRAGLTVHSILIDNGNTANILFIKPFEQMNLDKRMLEPARTRSLVLVGKRKTPWGRRQSRSLSQKARRST